jgi:hypothetical protein
MSSTLETDAVQRQATDAWQRAKSRKDAPVALIDRAWLRFLELTKSAQSADEAHAIAIEAKAVMEAFAGLSQPQLQALSGTDHLRMHVLHRSGKLGGEIQEAARCWAREVMDSHPALAKLQAENDRLDKERTDRERHLQELDKEEAERTKPARLLASLRMKGVHLEADDKGRLTAPRGTVLSSDDTAEIVNYKAGLIALLAAEAAASTPLVIA